MKMSSTLHCKCLWTKSINNSILLFIFVHHININFFLSIFNKNFGMKNNLLSTILFLIKNFTFLKTPLILKKFLKKKELYRHKSNWLILSVVMRKTKIIEMEFKKRNLQNEISKLNNIFLKKKRVLLKKFEKFYQDYLGVTLKISNNIFVWKFLDYNGIGKKKNFYHNGEN